MNIIEAKPDATDLKIAIVVSRFNEVINNKLVQGATERFKELDGDEENLTLFKVPGAFEIPLTCKKLALTNKYNGICALGTVIKGGTIHFEIISYESARGLTNISLETGIPIGLGILTTQNFKQANERANTQAGNKGGEAMHATIEMVKLLQQIN